MLRWGRKGRHRVVHWGLAGAAAACVGWGVGVLQKHGRFMWAWDCACLHPLHVYTLAASTFLGSCGRHHALMRVIGRTFESRRAQRLCQGAFKGQIKRLGSDEEVECGAAHRRLASCSIDKDGVLGVVYCACVGCAASIIGRYQALWLQESACKGMGCTTESDPS